MRVCVIGAGFFGSVAAIRLAESGHEVDLLERSDDMLQGASRHNHNRIHLGYHYLRSIETAQESREGLPTFMEFFGQAICTDFANFYAIAAEGSKSTPQQFEKFCDNVGIAYRSEYPAHDLMDRARLAACYRVPEPVFDFFRVHALLTERFMCSDAVFHPNTAVSRIDRTGDLWRVEANSLSREYDAVVNCTYSALNQINALVGAKPKTYLYEDVLIPIFKYDHPMLGLTIMDGEFCSVMPRGYREGEFLLYHVKHSVLSRNLGHSPPAPNPELPTPNPQRLFTASTEYMPFLAQVEPVGQYRCMRVVWENDDDARRSIISNDAPNFWSVLSGKVTTCVNVANELGRQLETV